MTSGVVTSVTPRRLGDTLDADVPAGAVVLPLGNAGDFSEDFSQPRYLVIGESMVALQYVAVENDDDASQQSVTLAAPLAEPFEAGLPVTLWDPTVDAVDKRVVEMTAHVLLDDQDDAPGVEVVVPHGLVPLAGFYSLVGARVALAERDDEEWVVETVLGRNALISDTAIYGPGGEETFTVDEAGHVTTIGEFGTAPPGEVGVFAFSNRFSNAGEQVTWPTVQLNVGLTRDQPSIQADTETGASLRLFSGANSNQRESSLRLENGQVRIGVEDTPDSENLYGAQLFLHSDAMQMRTRYSYGTANLAGLVEANPVGNFFAGWRNDDTGGLQGLQSVAATLVRILTSGNLEVVNPSATGYRDVRAADFVDNTGSLRDAINDLQAAINDLYSEITRLDGRIDNKANANHTHG